MSHRRRGLLVMVPAILGLTGACALEPQELLPPNAPGHPMAYVTLGLAFRDDIYLLTAQGQEHNLTSHAADDSWPSWSPDGLALAFQSDRDRLGKMEVYLVQFPGTDTNVVSRLTADTGSQDGQPAWSPSGNRLAFVSNRDSAGFDIYLMTPAGTSVVRLTSDSGNSSQPAWAPLGNRLAFASDRSGVVDIYVMDTLGGNVVNLTDSPATDLAPQWSPDGTKIAFHSNRGPTQDFAIWVMNADGSNLMQITTDETPCELPHWTPDGLRLTFDCDGDIYVANTDGSNLMQITRTTNQQRIEFMARWRP